MTLDPTVPPSDHARLQAAVDALCQQLADYQPAVELAQQKPEPRPTSGRCHTGIDYATKLALYVAEALYSLRHTA